MPWLGDLSEKLGLAENNADYQNKFWWIQSSIEWNTAMDIQTEDIPTLTVVAWSTTETIDRTIANAAPTQEKRVVNWNEKVSEARIIDFRNAYNNLTNGLNNVMLSINSHYWKKEVDSVMTFYRWIEELVSAYEDVTDAKPNYLDQISEIKSYISQEIAEYCIRQNSFHFNDALLFIWDLYQYPEVESKVRNMVYAWIKPSFEQVIESVKDWLSVMSNPTAKDLLVYYSELTELHPEEEHLVNTERLKLELLKLFINSGDWKDVSDAICGWDISYVDIKFMDDLPKESQKALATKIWEGIVNAAYPDFIPKEECAAAAQLCDFVLRYEEDYIRRENLTAYRDWFKTSVEIHISNNVKDDVVEFRKSLNTASRLLELTNFREFDRAYVRVKNDLTDKRKSLYYNIYMSREQANRELFKKYLEEIDNMSDALHKAHVMLQPKGNHSLNRVWIDWKIAEAKAAAEAEYEDKKKAS